jgi:hypothetical protein
MADEGKQDMSKSNRFFLSTDQEPREPSIEETEQNEDLQDRNLALQRELYNTRRAVIIEQQRIRHNNEYIAERKLDDGILPGVRDAEEATRILEQNLQTLQQRVVALETELQMLNLNGANVNIQGAFFQNALFYSDGEENGPVVNDEEYEPVSKSFQTLNRRYNDRN